MLKAAHAERIMACPLLACMSEDEVIPHLVRGMRRGSPVGDCEPRGILTDFPYLVQWLPLSSKRPISNYTPIEGFAFQIASLEVLADSKPITKLHVAVF